MKQLQFSLLSLFLFHEFQFFLNHCIRLCTGVNKIGICEAISGLFSPGFTGSGGVWGGRGLCLTPRLHFNDCKIKCKDLNAWVFFQWELPDSALPHVF